MWCASIVARVQSLRELDNQDTVLFFTSAVTMIIIKGIVLR